MRNEQVTRREAVGLGGAIAAALTVGTAGCVDQVQRAVGMNGGGADLGKVPEDAEAVFGLDVAGALSDETVTATIDTYFEHYAAQQDRYYDYTGPTSLEEALEEFEDETELDPESLQSLTAFYEYEGDTVDNQFGGAIVHAEWDTDDVEDAIEEAASGSDTDIEEDEYNGKTVFISESEYGADSWVGVLDATTFAVGTQDAVEAVIDTAQGDEDALGDELKSAYNGLPSGYASYATEVPSTDAFERYDERQEDVDVTTFEDVDLTGGALYVNDETVGLEWHLIAGDEDEAEDILETLEDGRDEMVAELEESESDEADQVIEAVESIELAQDGNTVTLTYETTADEIEGVIEDVYATPSGGTSTPVEDHEGNIQASTSVDFDAGSDQIRVVYTASGDEDTALRVEIYNAEGGTPPSPSVVSLTEVGDSYTWDLDDGTTYMVRVTAVRGNDSAIIYERQDSL